MGIDTGPSWSPDGYFLAFSTHGRSNNRSIYVMRADNSGEVQRLTNGIPPGSGFPTEVAPNWQPLPGPGDPTGEFTSLTPARIVDTAQRHRRQAREAGSGPEFDVQINGQGGVPSDRCERGGGEHDGDRAHDAELPHRVACRRDATDAVEPQLRAGADRCEPGHGRRGRGGKVSVYNNAGATHVIFDVVGFYADSAGPAGSRFHALTPFRLFDTRTTKVRWRRTRPRRCRCWALGRSRRPG